MAAKKKENLADINTDKDMDERETDSVEPNPLEKKKGKGCLIFFIIFILLTAGAITAIWFNLFGIRDNYLRGLLERVPVVNNVLPPVEAEDPVATLSPEELIAEIDSLKADNELLAAEVSRLNDLNSTYLKEIETLREFETNQLQFREDKAAFDYEVGTGDPVSYESYYAQISPENAAEIYREVVGTINNDREFKNFVSTFENMDESSAAEIFNQMVNTDLDLTVRILRNISSEQRAAIMASMTTASAEQVTRRMAPLDTESP